MSNKQKNKLPLPRFQSKVFGVNLIPRGDSRHVLLQLCKLTNDSNGDDFWEEIGTYSSAWLGGIQMVFKNIETHLAVSGKFEHDGSGYRFVESSQESESELLIKKQKEETINKLISELGKQNQLYALSRGDLESTAFHIAKIQEKEAALLKAINS